MARYALRGGIVVNDKLKPCPFCGNKKIIISTMDEEFIVRCAYTEDGCGASTGFFDEKEEAITAWNRRTENG